MANLLYTTTFETIPHHMRPLRTAREWRMWDRSLQKQWPLSISNFAKRQRAADARLAKRRKTFAHNRERNTHTALEEKTPLPYELIDLVASYLFINHAVA